MTADLAPTQTGVVTLDGVTLAYRERGEPSDPPVVLLHGGFSRASTWDTFAAALAQAGRHAIALEMRGHGASSHPGHYSVSLMAGDVLAFLDHRGLAKADLVGHSLGGIVAWRCALQWPDRVRRLVIEDVPPPPVTDGRSEPPAEPPEPVDFDWAMARPIFHEVRSPDPWWRSKLPSQTTPTLLLTGGPTSHIDPARIIEAAALMPDARVVHIGAGHHIHRERPAEFAHAVLPFLADAVTAEGVNSPATPLPGRGRPGNERHPTGHATAD